VEHEKTRRDLQKPSLENFRGLPSSVHLRPLPETRPAGLNMPALFETLWRMLRDGDIWRSTLLVALFNIALQRGFSGWELVRLAALLTLAGGIGVWLLQDNELFVLAMLVVVLAFGIAIPNLLGAALSNYNDRLGTAGALFGLLYYLLIGGGLILVGWAQALSESLVVCGIIAVVLVAVPARRQA
jgi:hypothetical protein